MGARMSALPITQFCGLAARLGAQHGAGRAAAVSSAFHALCAGDESKYRMLTDEERVELEAWEKPTDVAIPNGPLLKYAEAVKELAVALDTFGWPVLADNLNAATPGVFTLGHLDFAWAAETETSEKMFCSGCYPPHGAPGLKICNGHVQTMRIAYVADIKATRWTSSGPDSLQLHAYAIAFAKANDCEGYVTGIWVATEGKWHWATEIVWLGSEHAELRENQVLGAAGNDQGEANKGAHCTNCWERLHCPEWVLPVADGKTHLLLIGSNGQKPTNEEAVQALLEYKAASEVLRRFKENMEEWVKRGLVTAYDPGTKMQWGPVKMPGRQGVDMAALRAKLGDQLRPFMTEGKPYEQYRWLKRAT